MKNYKIYLHKKGDGIMRLHPYMGESLETESADYGGRGFHVSNHRDQSVLKFGEPLFDTAYEIGGIINLKSHIDRIIKRMRQGKLENIDKIIIGIEEE